MDLPTSWETLESYRLASILGGPCFLEAPLCSPGHLQKAICKAFPELFADIGRQMSEAVPPDGFGNGEAGVVEGRLESESNSALF